jgi:hypothetical protein
MLILRMETTDTMKIVLCKHNLCKRPVQSGDGKQVNNPGDFSYSWYCASLDMGYI